MSFLLLPYKLPHIWQLNTHLLSHSSAGQKLVHSVSHSASFQKINQNVGRTAFPSGSSKNECFHAYSSCWLNSAGWSCRTEVLVCLLAVGHGSLTCFLSAIAVVVICLWVFK